MNRIEKRLKAINSELYSRLEDTKEAVDHFLQKYSVNFVTYTDHSINHTKEVFKIVGDILNDTELESLNDKELYILGMAALLHDIGMCIPEEEITNIESNKHYT